MAYYLRLEILIAPYIVLAALVGAGYKAFSGDKQDAGWFVAVGIAEIIGFLVAKAWLKTIEERNFPGGDGAPGEEVHRNPGSEG